MYYEAVYIAQTYMPFAIPVVLTAFLVVFIDKILGHVTGKSKKLAARMTKNVMEHEDFKPVIDALTNMPNCQNCALKAEIDRFALIMLEDALRRYFYELKDNFNSTIYREGFLKQKEIYESKGGNGIIKTWDAILSDIYRKQATK